MKTMMEDKQLNEKESLELIARMIQNSKKNMEVGSGNLFLLWGYLSVLTAVAVLLLVWQTGYMKWNWLWFAIPLVGWPLQAYLKRKDKRPVRTYTDKVIGSIWSVMGWATIAAVLIFCIEAHMAPFIVPIIVLCAGIGVSITGSVLDDRWMRYSGMMSVFIGLFSFYNGMDVSSPGGWYWNSIIYAVCFVVMFIIPGHKLNREARRLQQKGDKNHV